MKPSTQEINTRTLTNTVKQLVVEISSCSEILTKICQKKVTSSKLHWQLLVRKAPLSPSFSGADQIIVFKYQIWLSEKTQPYTGFLTNTVFGSDQN